MAPETFTAQPSPDTAFQKYPGLCQLAELHVLRESLQHFPDVRPWRQMTVDGISVAVLAFDTLPSYLVNTGYPETPLSLVLFDGNRVTQGREFHIHSLYLLLEMVNSRAKNPYMNPSKTLKQFASSVNTAITTSGIRTPTQGTLKRAFLRSIGMESSGRNRQ